MQTWKATAPTTTVQEAIDSVCVTSVNDSLWRGFRSGTQSMGDSRFKSRDVESGVYSPHGSRETKANGSRADDSDDGKWPHKVRSQFLGAPLDRNVLGGEPHVLTDPVGRSRDASPVGQLLQPG